MKIFSQGMKPYYNKTLKIALPCIIEMALLSVVNIVDAIMVGGLGPTAIAAVGVNHPVGWLIGSLCAGISIGTTVQVAMNVGAGELQKASNAARQGIAFAFVFGLFVLFCVYNLSPYIPRWIGAQPEVLPDAIIFIRTTSLAICLLFVGFVSSGVLRGAGYTRIPMMVAAFVNVVNIVGNFFLIYPSRTVSFFGREMYIWGADMGVQGSAIATAFAQSLTGIILFSILLNKRLLVHICYDLKFRFEKQILANILKVGLPTSGERISINLGLVVYMSIVANLGTIALSAHYVANIVESLSYMPAEGFSAAATTLVGQSQGSKKKEDTLIYCNITLFFAVICGTICGAVFLLFPQPLFSLFTDNSEVIISGSKALAVMAVAEPFLSVVIVTSGILRGAGDTKMPFYIVSISMWGVRLITAWFFAYKLGLGLTGAWIGMALDIMTKFVLIRIRYTRKKWLNTEVRTD